MDRRTLIKGLAALGLSPASLALAAVRADKKDMGAFDVAVVGAGVFGMFTAITLQQAGQRVVVVEKSSPAHSRSSSGGESRVIRCGYGDIDLYTDWASRSLETWKKLSHAAALPLFHPIGVLWLHKEGDPFAQATHKTLKRFGLDVLALDHQALGERYPVMRVEPDDAALIEPAAGGLMARRAVQTLAEQFISNGGTILIDEIEPIRRARATGGSYTELVTNKGNQIKAGQIILACGPWLDQVAPEAMSERLFVTRQEILYFAATRQETGDLPVWADLPFYGLPDIEGRGFKVANDTHGAIVNPDSHSRRVSPEGEDEARAFLARRFPKIADKPVTETRVCQYENTSNGDFVIDRHPGIDNVWIVGGGSGHGFKHGPALGSHVAGLVMGNASMIPRFALASKETRHQREVQ